MANCGISNYITAINKVSWTLFQTDLRITNHRGHKFPLSLTLISFKTQIQC